MRTFRRLYGAGPGHLLMMLGAFAMAGYVASILTTVPLAGRIGIWFAGAALAHDLVLWPAYAVADRVLTRLHAGRAGRPSRSVPWVNHVRVPAVLSFFLLVVSFPLVLDRSGASYRRATGLSPTPYTARWLLITAVVFGASAVLYLVRLLAARRRR